MTVMHEPRERRSERVSVGLTPTMMARLSAYAAEHRWTVSTAAAFLLEDALSAEDQGKDNQETRSR